MGSPGHHGAAITVYDPWTGILLTGDTVLSRPAVRVRLRRVRGHAWTAWSPSPRAAPVTHVLGCHVEMTGRPGRDFPLGATYQPDERALQMTRPS